MFKKIAICICFTLCFCINESSQANLTIEQIGQIKTAISDLYSDVVAAKGAALELNFNLENTGESAFSKKMENDTKWVINVNGGMINHSLMNQRSMGLIICHEVGHFLGGKPYIQGKKITPIMTSTAPRFMAVEGQADFFSTADCGKKLFKKLNFISNPNPNVPTGLLNDCVGAGTEMKICAALIDSSKRVTDIYLDIVSKIDHIQYPETSFSNKDLSIVPRTLVYVGEYPSLQCRLDTMLAGLKCKMNQDGSCMGESNELRPACWFKVNN